MAKVALKTRISLPSVEFITSWTFSQSWALKNIPNLYWANVEVAAKHSAMEVSWALSSSATFVEGIALRISMRLQTVQAETWYAVTRRRHRGARTEGACRREYCLQERNLRQVLQFQHGREAEYLTFTDDTADGAYKGGQPC